MNSDYPLDQDAAPASTSTEDDITGLPALGSWRAVYVFVTVVFLVYVVLLGALSRVYA
jgi:hypothetical protein